MKIYLAASYSRRLELLGYAQQLEALGHQVVSSWVDGHHETNSPHGSQADKLGDSEEQSGWATEDIRDIFECETLVLFTGGDHRKRGGRHVEYGIALGLGKSLVLIGQPENVFHHLGSPVVRRFPTWEAFLVWERIAGNRRAGYLRVEVEKD